MRNVPLAAILAIAFAAEGTSGAFADSQNAQSKAAERAYLRTVSSLTANDVTANLRGVVGTRVSFVCEIVSVVDPRTMIGQCGKDEEPVDIYVHMPTTGVRSGQRFRVIGEMETPSVWVDVVGHPWYTGFVKAHFVDRLR